MTGTKKPGNQEESGLFRDLLGRSMCGVNDRCDAMETLRLHYTHK